MACHPRTIKDLFIREQGCMQSSGSVGDQRTEGRKPEKRHQRALRAQLTSASQSIQFDGEGGTTTGWKVQKPKNGPGQPNRQSGKARRTQRTLWTLWTLRTLHAHPQLPHLPQPTSSSCQRQQAT